MGQPRFRRKDLKRPDEFVSRGRKVIEWVASNTRLLAQIGAGIVVLLLVVAGVTSVQSARARQANDDLAQALNEFHAGNHGAAATKLLDVASRWPSSAPGRFAKLFAASANLQADNPEAAVSALEELLDVRDWPSYLRQDVLVLLAHALDVKGDHDGAAKRYNEAASLDGPYLEVALLGEARCRERLGQRDQARALYERYVREFPDTPDAAAIQSKVAALI